MVDAPTTAYTEIQIDEDSISLTLITESGDGVTIEDTERFTFDELQELAGEHRNLRLTTDTRAALSEIQQRAQISFIDDRSQSEIRTGYETPDVGDVMKDTGDLPSWAEERRVRIINVTETRADEYEVPEADGFIGTPTVADLNRDEPEDAPVVVGNYIGSESEYAFPVTRLEPVGN